MNIVVDLNCNSFARTISEVEHMKKKQVIILAVIVMVIIGGYRGCKYYFDLKTYRNQVGNITISNIDVSKLADGIYTGSYEIMWVAAEVKVTVNNHKIEGIELLKHENDRGTSAEIIPSQVVEAQSLEVDAVSGATSSSKVILKAIENALNSVPK